MIKITAKKQLGQFLFDMSFEVKNGEVVVVLGESGCGKSTLLNLISGIIPLDKGYIATESKIYADSSKGISMPIHKRKIAYIQQKSNLFPHLTSIENIRYGLTNLTNRNVDEEDIRLRNLLKTFKLESHLEKYPHQLSGGQKQRVAIVRAVMTQPEVLLFDEPFSALDNLIRDCLRNEVAALKELLNIPIIFVTHDLEEAYTVGDRVLFVENGKVVEIGNTRDIFHSPTKINTAKFVGITNILSGSSLGSYCYNDMEFQNVKLDEIALKVDSNITGISFKEDIFLGIKPSNILFIRQDRPASKDLEINQFKADIISMKIFCDTCKLKIKIHGLTGIWDMRLSYYTMKKHNISENTQITISIRPEHILILKL